MTEIVQTKKNIELKNYEVNEFNPLTPPRETNPFELKRFQNSYFVHFQYVEWKRRRTTANDGLSVIHFNVTQSQQT